MGLKIAEKVLEQGKGWVVEGRGVLMEEGEDEIYFELRG